MTISVENLLQDVENFVQDIREKVDRGYQIESIYSDENSVYVTFVSPDEEHYPIISFSAWEDEDEDED